jgi:ATP phosphoribosyltransferase regulatory subunit
MRHPEHIPGTKDYTRDEARRLLEVSAACLTTFDLYGYERIILPVLERSDIFLQRSGEEIRSRMYIFADPKGSELCLRPEMTISAARAYLERMPNRRLPLRLSYEGSVFRFDKVREGRYRQFVQAGVEYLGSENRTAADVEAVALALEAIKKSGLSNFRLLLGDLELAAEFINALPISAPVRSTLLEHYWRRKAFQLLLKRYAAPPQNADRDDPTARQLADILATIGEDASRAVVRQILSLFVEKEIGQRDLDEIAESFLRRFSRRELRLPADCLGVLEEYMAIAGPPDATLAQLEKLFDKIGSAPGRAFENAQRRIELLKEMGCLPNDTDFALGFRRGIEYYTGLIFEIHDDGLGPVSQICGGGRYDNLIAALGAPRQIPAIGFAIGVERLWLALERDQALPQSAGDHAVDAVLTSVGKVSESDAWRIAQLCRQAGWRVRADLDHRKFTTVLGHASDDNVRFTIIVGEDELRHQSVKVKDMRRREEKVVAIENLRQFVEASVSGDPQ